MLFKEWIEQASFQFADQPAITWQNNRWNYQQLYQQIESEAQRFNELGIAQHQLVMVSATQENLLRFLALWFIDVALIPINPKFTNDQIESLQAEQSVHWWVDGSGACHKNNIVKTDPLLTPLSLGIYTSGSTGHPKLAMFNFDALLRSAEGANQLIPMAPGHLSVLSLPYFHVGGIGILLRAWHKGAQVLVSDEPLPNLLNRFPTISHLSLVATQLSRLLQDSMPMAPPYCLVGGGPVDTQLLAAATDKGFGVWFTYGLTEMGSQVVTHSPDGLAQVLPHRQLSISTSGEILVKGEVLFAGYLKNGQLTLSVDEEGWFHTRDLGEFHQSQFKVMGRLDNQFISGGENIQPEWIEQQLVKTLDLEAVVVVPVPNEEWGQRPFAFLSPLPETPWPQIRQNLAAKMPSYLIPDQALPLPESTGLKISRQQLTKQARDFLQGVK